MEAESTAGHSRVWRHNLPSAASSSSGGNLETQGLCRSRSEAQVLSPVFGWQMAYQAWVTDAQMVLRQRREQERAQVQAQAEGAGQLLTGELCSSGLQGLRAKRH